MRSKKELYEIILNEYKELFYSSIFICNTIEICYEGKLITEEEFTFILNDFKNNYPSTSQHSEFMIESFWNDNREGSWWSVYDSLRNRNYSIRISFLEKLVRINS